MIKERPILFSGAMVRAILEGRKTVTRRAIKVQPHGAGAWVRQGISWLFPNISPHTTVNCPYGKPGDQLWVRETCFINGPDKGAEVTYKADPLPNWEGEEADIRWRPSIHMPRVASRIQLEIAAVRVERLQDISEADAKAEGLRYHPLYKEWGGVEAHPCNRPDAPQWRWYGSPIEAFKNLWQSINGPDSWNANPWVWVVEFRRINHQQEHNHD